MPEPSLQPLIDNFADLQRRYSDLLYEHALLQGRVLALALMAEGFKGEFDCGKSPERSLEIIEEKLRERNA